MDFKLLNCQICSQIKGLFASTQWYRKVIIAPISSRLHQVPSTVLCFGFIASFNPPAVLHVRRLELGGELTPLSGSSAGSGWGRDLDPASLPGILGL